MATAKTKPTIDTIAGECIAVRLRMLNRGVTNIYDEALRPLDLKVSQMNILVVAARLGTASPGAVGRILHLDASTLSRNLERMRRRGWLEAIEDASDARLQPFRVTAAGLTLLERAYPSWREAQVRASNLLGENGPEALAEAPGAVLSR